MFALKTNLSAYNPSSWAHSTSQNNLNLCFIIREIESARNKVETTWTGVIMPEHTRLYVNIFN